MARLRDWLNNHALLMAFVAFTVLIASGWVIYRYSANSQQTDLASTCCPIDSKYGPEGKMGSLLMNMGLKTLALDAVRKQFPKDELVFQNIKVLDAEKGLVEIIVSVGGKLKHLKVDLRYPNGKVIELPSTTTSHKSP